MLRRWAFAANSWNKSQMVFSFPSSCLGKNRCEAPIRDSFSDLQIVIAMTFGRIRLVAVLASREAELPRRVFPSKSSGTKEGDWGDQNAKLTGKWP